MLRMKLYALLLLALSSCSFIEGPTVFDRVADGYADEPQKQEAARYLQQYAKYHYGVSRHLNDTAGVAGLRLGIDNDSVYRHHLDSLKYAFVSGEPVMDEDTMTDDYLRENIDLAFEVWNRPWSKDLSFSDFCRYILPYRNGDEELHDWRRYLKDKYEGSIMDSVADPTSIRAVAQYLIRQFRKEIGYGPSMGSFSRNLLTTGDMERIHWMECRGCAHYVTLAMRACGIPCAMITTHWRFTEVPHTSVLFPAVGSNDRAFRLTIGDNLMYMGEPKDTMASWRTWQTGYEPNPELLELVDEYAASGKSNKALLQFALPVTRQDVTPAFSTTYPVLSLPVPDSLKEHRHLFLCRFHDWKWYPVQSGKVVGHSVHFKDATIRQWYRLGYADADSVRTFGGTFTLTADSGFIAKGTPPQIRPYDLTGDTVLFKMVYACKSDESRLTRRITTYYWNDKNEWQPLTRDAVLWGFNEKTSEYRVFDETLRGTFKPVFHLLQVRLPKWTVFTDNETPRPLGYLFTDKETGEGCLMQF